MDNEERIVQNNTDLTSIKNRLGVLDGTITNLPEYQDIKPIYNADEGLFVSDSSTNGSDTVAAYNKYYIKFDATHIYIKLTETGETIYSSTMSSSMGSRSFRCDILSETDEFLWFWIVAGPNGGSYEYEHRANGRIYYYDIKQNNLVQAYTFPGYTGSHDFAVRSVGNRIYVNSDFSNSSSSYYNRSYYTVNYDTKTVTRGNVQRKLYYRYAY